MIEPRRFRETCPAPYIPKVRAAIGPPDKETFLKTVVIDIPAAIDRLKGLTDPATVRLIRDRASARGLVGVVEAADARLAELAPTNAKAPKARTVRPRRKSSLVAG